MNISAFIASNQIQFVVDESPICSMSALHISSVLYNSTSTVALYDVFVKIEWAILLLSKIFLIQMAFSRLSSQKNEGILKAHNIIFLLRYAAVSKTDSHF